jgi:vancomycin resistance protein YoaR
VSDRFFTPRSGGTASDDEPRTNLLSQLSVSDGAGVGRRWRWVMIAVVGAVIILAGAYGVAYAMFGGEMPRDTAVAGIKIGGLSEDAAQDKLRVTLDDRLDNPIVVSVDQETMELDPIASGLGVDVAATVDQVSISGTPAGLWRALTGGDEIELVKTVDDEKLAASVQAVADRFNREPVDGSVGFAKGKVEAQPAVVGRTLDTKAAATEVVRAFPLAGGAVELPMTETQPAIDQADVDKAVAEFANPAMSGPVIIVAGDKKAELTPSLLSQALSLPATPDGVLQPVLDGDKLLKVGGTRVFGDLASGAKDATIRIENGNPVVVPSQAGQGIAGPDLSHAVLGVLTKTGAERTANVPVKTMEPKLTTEAATGLGVKQVISETTTQFPHADYRNTNIGRAASMIDNAFLKPGDTFSLNRIVGERTEANGFTVGWIIKSGSLVEDLGGGVSQVATTTFNAAYKAGLEDVEHKPHGLYFDRYPAGVEATVAWPSLDLKFKNDTPYGVVVDTAFSASAPGRQGSLTVRIWSSPYWTTNIQTSERYAPVKHGIEYNTSPECEAHAGQDGFQIDVTRTRSAPDKGTKTDKRHVVYKAGAQVVCGPKPGS